MSDKIKNILLVDDHPLLLSGLKKIIETEKDLKVCGEAGNATQAFESIKDQEPDLAIIDINLDDTMNGIDLVKVIKSRFPKIITLIISMHDENIYAERAVKAGASGYLRKKEAAEDVIKAIRKILVGELYLSEEISSRILAKTLRGSSDDKGTPVDILTDREHEVFNFMGSGLGTNEIAKKLNLSISTIETHKTNIKNKMKFKTSTEMMKFAIQWLHEYNR